MAKRDLCLDIESWRTPASDYAQAERGDARIRRYRINRSFYLMYDTKYRGNRYRFFQATKRLTGTMLTINRKVWMVDDPPHYYTIIDHARGMRGHVLCAGLGLGLIVHALLANDQVTAVTVVEKNSNVIDLVGPYVTDSRVRLINADWYEYVADFIPDAVFFDLFVGDGMELLTPALHTMRDLRRTYPHANCKILGFNNEILQANADKLLTLNVDDL